MKPWLIAVLSVAFGLSAEAQEQPIADMVLYGGPIYTADDSNPTAGAVAIKNGRFLYVGDRSGLTAMIGEQTTEIDLKGHALFPGFVDGHAHFSGIGNRELSFNLEGVSSLAEMKVALKNWRDTHPDDPLILGRGWIETHWPEQRFPSRFDLDEIISDVPVILHRSDGHASVVNSLALKMANITGDTEPPFGGAIHKNALGEATGMLIDNARALLRPLAGLAPQSSLYDQLVKANDVYVQYGWTGVHNVSVSWAQMMEAEQLSDDGAIGLRLHNALDPEAADALFASGARASSNGRIVTNGLKLYLDGALGSRGAALLEPYADADTMGLITVRKDQALPLMREALRRGFQVKSHAIGDRGNREILNWYEQVFAEIPVDERAVADPRWRVEHAQHISAEDLPRFKALGVIPSMQPSHAIGDLHFAPDRLGDARLDGAYAWQSLIDDGNIIVGGSDAPVERGDPLIEFYAAVSRSDLKGFQGENWRGEQAVSRDNALKMFTLWPAISVFQENDLGSITVGKKADLSAFSVDLMTVDFADIPKAHATLTIVDGDILYHVE